MAHETANNPDSVPPIGLPPAGEDFVHPWIVSAIVTTLMFVLGFGVLWLTGLWAKIHQWADAPFMFYFAVLMPVIVGFSIYALCLLVYRALGKTPPHRRVNEPVRPEDEMV
ncbi:MAG: hypothetical protein AMXMBFR7_19350 [Planctomycetota bacterium]